MAQPPERAGNGPGDRPERRDRAGRNDRHERGSAQAVRAKSGTITEFTKNPEGQTDGFLLDDGTEVRFRPEAGDKVGRALAVKDQVTIEGWRHSGEQGIHAGTIKIASSGKTLTVDRPPPELAQPGQGDRQGNPEDEADRRTPPRRSETSDDDRPPQPDRKDSRKGNRNQPRQYCLEQATSDHAQLHTIAFDGMAYLTGDFGYDTFLPPGKVSDYFGFQYMRDIDAKEGGHNTSFLTRIAYNMLAILDDDQKAQLIALAKAQDTDIRRFAEMRFPLIKAFRRNLENDLPAGSEGLDKKAVMGYSAKLYQLDGQLAFERAKVMGGILSGLNPSQKAALARLKFGDSRTWPDVPETLDRRSLSHAVHVAVMTYASEMFAWQGGSLEADTYFCPERHGMYFGGFGMKTAPAMGKRDYSISTSLTADSGEVFLATLTEPQRKHVTDLVDLQRDDLAEIVRTRRAIATELRRFLRGEPADKDKVLSLSRRYGELDGELSYLYATAFANVARTLTTQQRFKLAGMRTTNPSDPKGPFLYSAPIRMPEVSNTDFLFGAR